MKNIHVLPTEKPSRLYYFGNSSELRLTKYPNPFRAFERSTQNIYITSDEIGKHSEYVYWEKDTERPIKFQRGEYLGAKKIILTTDQDLIKDGIQAIDDEFLEYFVKNPSCEFVEVIPLRKSSGYYDDEEVWHWDFLAYKIIIPQQEPKQEPKQEWPKSTGDIVSDNAIAQSKAIQKCMQLDAKMAYNSLPKQETLEEGLLHHIKFCLECGNEAQAIRLIEKYGFEMQEQDKNKYSEEDMTKFVSFVGKNYIKAKGFYYMKGDFEKKHKVSIHQIFEQFKKK